jgi:hypothetical protein
MARRGLLAVADHDGVEERREGSGCVAVGPPAITSGSSSPRSARAGDAAEVEHEEDVGVGELELEREAHHVEVAERARALSSETRGSAARAELGLHVGPRRVAALGERASGGVVQIP